MIPISQFPLQNVFILTQSLDVHPLLSQPEPIERPRINLLHENGQGR